MTLMIVFKVTLALIALMAGAAVAGLAVFNLALLSIESWEQFKTRQSIKDLEEAVAKTLTKRLNEQRPNPTD